jgi:hypothetical protein
MFIQLLSMLYFPALTYSLNHVTCVIINGLAGNYNRRVQLTARQELGISSIKDLSLQAVAINKNLVSGEN